MAQAPYPQPVDSPTDDLADTAKATAREILKAPSLLSFLASKQRNTLGGLPKGVKHPAVALLNKYVEEGIPAHTGAPWSPESLATAISKGTHASACTPEMTSFVRGELRRRIKDGFSILLPVADAMQLFGRRLNLSRIVAVPQSHRRPCLVLNLSMQPYSDTIGVNETTNREAAPDLLQFGWAFSRILQAVWEADPVQGLFRVSKLYVTDAYHRGTIAPAQLGAFAYVIPSVPGYEGIFICIDLVLLMGWVDSPKFFCAFFGNANRCGKFPGELRAPCPVLRRNI